MFCRVRQEGKVKKGMILCKCGFVREIGVVCTACPLREMDISHVLADTPANQAALAPVAAQLYNALGELARHASPMPGRDAQAALMQAQRVLEAARVRSEARSVENAVNLAAEVSPGSVAKALRRIGPQAPIVRRPYEALEDETKKG
jgi:hypothetical protein